MEKEVPKLHSEEHGTEEIKKLEEWLRDHKIDEVECLVPDLSGIGRGKIFPQDKFLSGLKNKSLHLPDSIFAQLVTGRYTKETVVSAESFDIRMIPDLNSLRVLPWYENPSAQVICDVVNLKGAPVKVAPRQVLKNILKKYDERGWQPIIAPELEFYLIRKNLDPNVPLEPAEGISGRSEYGEQAYGIEALNEYDPIINLIYEYCETSRLDIDSVLHESGPAQLEMNFLHSNALELADQVFLFKRTVRQAALKNNSYATFMAKPYSNQPGSAMHLHQSLIEKKSGRNIFSEGAKESQLFKNYLGGLQEYLLAATALLFPNINSYRRIENRSDVPINLHWGSDNRTVGLRVPISNPQNRRIENRLPGADVNPYLSIATNLVCGFIGIEELCTPSDPIEGDASKYARKLPYHPYEALNRLARATPLKKWLGEEFIKLYLGVKEEEIATFNRLVSSWERENLLLTV